MNLFDKIKCKLSGHNFEIMASEPYHTLWATGNKSKSTVHFRKCTLCAKRGIVTEYGDFPNKYHAKMINDIWMWKEVGVKPYKITHPELKPKPKNNDNLAALGLSPTATYTKVEIKKAWRKQIMIVHPDQGGSPAEFDIVNAAYKALK